MELYVQGRGQSGPLQPAGPTAPKTPITRVTAPTFPAPVTRPGQSPRPGVVAAVSDDGLWRYDRFETGDGSDVLRWLVTFVPTGQTSWHPSLDAAREATAGTLLAELRTEAVDIALGAGTDKRRAAGQRWLAVHMRMHGHTNVDTGCACGGLLTVATRDGRYVHVDACPGCRDTLPESCPDPAGHRFCARPDPELTDDERRMLAFERQWWRQPGSKLVAIREEFAGLSETGYYAALNRLIDKPSAMRYAPALVRRLQRLRQTRQR